MKLLDNEMVELTAEDLRHTMPGMPCVADGYITTFLYADDEAIGVFEQEWGTKFHRYRAAYERGENDGYYREVNFFCCLSITARLRDWQVYTARRVFEMNPVANYITPGRWWKTQPAYHDGQWYPGEYGEEMDPDNWGVNGPVNIPDIWAGTPDDQAISREEVEDDEK